MTEPLLDFDPRYEILDKIHEGGMGAIYRARHRLLGVVRVVKVLRPELAASDELRERFVREARAAIELEHPNIARLYDFSVDASGRSYMVMEHIRGVNLRELLRHGGGAPPLSLTLDIARQGLTALGYLHRRHYVHRDISPENLMLAADPDGRPLVKLIDLGIVKQLESDAGLTSTGIFLGKVHYASPEQFGQAAPLDARSDLYSFGVLLYELLTTTRPIEGADLPSLISGHLHRAPIPFEASDPQRRVPAPLRAAVLAALEKVPAARPASADELRLTLERLARELPEVAADSLPAAFERVARCLESAGRALEWGAATTPPARLPTGSAPAATSAAAPDSSATVVGRDETATRSGAYERTTSLAGALGPAAGPRAPARRPRLLAAGALLALAAFAVLLAWIGWGRRTAETAAPAVHGVLLIEARPWAEVVEIASAAGIPVALPAERSTPLRIGLPAGRYRIVLRHPGAPEARGLDVEVGAGPEASRVEAVFFGDGARRFLAEVTP